MRQLSHGKNGVHPVRRLFGSTNVDQQRDDGHFDGTITYVSFSAINCSKLYEIQLGSCLAARPSVGWIAIVASSSA